MHSLSLRRGVQLAQKNRLIPCCSYKAHHHETSCSSKPIQIQSKKSRNAFTRGNHEMTHIESRNPLLFNSYLFLSPAFESVALLRVEIQCAQHARYPHPAPSRGIFKFLLQLCPTISSYRPLSRKLRAHTYLPGLKSLIKVIMKLNNK